MEAMLKFQAESEEWHQQLLVSVLGKIGDFFTSKNELDVQQYWWKLLIMLLTQWQKYCSLTAVYCQFRNSSLTVYIPLNMWLEYNRKTKLIGLPSFCPFFHIVKDIFVSWNFLSDMSCEYLIVLDLLNWNTFA